MSSSRATLYAATLLPSLCLGATLLAASAADACTWYIDQGVYDVLPADGERLPADAPLLITSQGLDPKRLTVTVNGEPAELVMSEEPFSPWSNDIMGYEFALSRQAWVVPAPKAGDLVHLSGEPCAEDRYPLEAHEQGSPCKALDHHLEVVAPEAAPARGAPTLTYDVLRVPALEDEPATCGADQDDLFYFHVDAGPWDADSALPRFAVISRKTEAEGWMPWMGRHLDGPTVTFRRGMDGRREGDGRDGECWRLEIVDALGRRSATSAEICQPCRERVDTRTLGELSKTPAHDGLQYDIERHPELDWTDADLHPDGQCVPEPDEPMEGHRGNGGCDVSGGRSTTPLLLFALLLGLGRRRKG